MFFLFGFLGSDHISVKTQNVNTIFPEVTAELRKECSEDHVQGEGN